MSNIVELVRFFETTHQTTLAKYRGTPWHLNGPAPNSSREEGGASNGLIGYEILDKTTGRHLADTYSGDGESFSVYTVHMTAEAIEKLKELRNPTFPSAHEAAKFVWTGTVGGMRRGLWHSMSWFTIAADWLVALAKALLKFLVAAVSVLALIFLLVGLKEDGGLYQRTYDAVMSIFTVS